MRQGQNNKTIKVLEIRRPLFKVQTDLIYVLKVRASEQWFSTGGSYIVLTVFVFGMCIINRTLQN